MLEFFMGYIAGGLLTGLIMTFIIKKVHKTSGTLYVDKQDPTNLYLEIDSIDSVYLPAIEFQVKHVNSHKKHSI